MSLPEVRALLDARRREREAAEGGAYVAPPLVAKALAYAERFDGVRSGVRADQLVASLEGRGGLTHAEVAALINLSPGTPDEARALVGTLADGGRDLPDEELQAVLDEIATYKSIE
jgi:DNA-directed RNA polymerase subunit F